MVRTSGGTGRAVLYLFLSMYPEGMRNVNRDGRLICRLRQWRRRYRRFGQESR